MAKKRKVHSLTGRIDDRLMREAFKAVKRNRGAAGIDKVSIGMFEENLDANLAALKRDLKTRGAFCPKPLRRVWIPKDAKGTKFRPLGIPAVRDRIAQEVIRRLLEPIFEPLFHDCSFGFRPRRSCHKAIERVLSFHAEGDRVTLDADISGFFDNIPHKLIVGAVAEEVADGNILNLIEKFLAAGVMEGGVFKPTTVGTPQGGVIAPPTKVQNFLLAAFASFLRKKGEVDPVDDPKLLFFDLDAVYQRAQNLATKRPVCRLQVRVDRRCEVIQTGQRFS